MKAFSQFVREAYAVLDSTRFERRTPTSSELKAASVKPPKEDYILEAALPPPGTTRGAVTMYKKPQPNISPQTPLTSSRQTLRNFGQDYKRRELIAANKAELGQPNYIGGGIFVIRRKQGMADIRGTQPPRQQPPATQPPRQQPPATQPPRQQPPATQPPRQQRPATQPPRQQRPATQPPRQQRPATGQIVAAAGGKGGTVTVGTKYAATLGGQKGYVTYDAAGKKSFTANEPAAAKPQPTGKPIAAAPAPAAPTPAPAPERVNLRDRDPRARGNFDPRYDKKPSAPSQPTAQPTGPERGSNENNTTDPEKKDPRQRRISQKYDIFPFTPRKAEETD